MKNRILTLSAVAFLALGAFGLNSCQQKVEAKEAAATINVPTAKCSSCAKHIKKAAMGVDGVTGVDVNTETHVATVKYDPSKTSVTNIDGAIAKSGYTADKTPRDSAAYAGLDDCCK